MSAQQAYSTAPAQARRRRPDIRICESIPAQQVTRGEHYPVTAGRPPRTGEQRRREATIPEQAIARLWREVERLNADPAIDVDPRYGQPGWRQAVAVVALRYVAPVRSAAAGRLTWGNILPLDGGWMRVSCLDKGGSETRCDIAPEFWRILEPLLLSLDAGAGQPECPLFGEFLSHDAVNRRTRRVTLLMAGRRYHAHSMRHTAGGHAAAAGASCFEIAGLLGNLPTTCERYYIAPLVRNLASLRLVQP